MIMAGEDLLFLSHEHLGRRIPQTRLARGKRAVRCCLLILDALVWCGCERPAPGRPAVHGGSGKPSSPPDQHLTNPWPV